MTPPIFKVLNSDSAVKALLFKNNILRVFEFGLAPDQPELPYVVWSTVAGTPANYLATRPDMDSTLIQIDCYGATATQVKQVANTVRFAIETNCYITALRGTERETDGSYHVGFDASWQVER